MIPAAISLVLLLLLLLSVIESSVSPSSCTDSCTDSSACRVLSSSSVLCSSIAPTARRRSGLDITVGTLFLPFGVDYTCAWKERCYCYTQSHSEFMVIELSYSFQETNMYQLCKELNNSLIWDCNFTKILNSSASLTYYAHIYLRCVLSQRQNYSSLVL